MKRVLAFVRTALLVLSLLTLGLQILAAIALHQFADKTWWGTLLAFGPRWVLLVPLGALLPVILMFGAGRALVVWVGATGVAVFGVLGVCLPLSSFFQLDGPDDKPLTTMTANLQNQREIAPRLAEVLAKERIDLVAVEEWNPNRSLARALPDWHVVEMGQLGIASRYPVKLVGGLNFADFVLGNDGQLLHAELQLDKQVVHIYVVHLETPREGLEELLGSIRQGRSEMDRNAQIRSIESAAARRYIDEVGGQFIVLGDFNLPVESRIYRRYWSAFKNAFSDGGLGLGHTKRTTRIGIRIDHVLCGPGCDVSSAHLGPDLGSDHLPMVAKLRLHPAL